MTTPRVADRRFVVIIVVPFVCKTSVGQHHQAVDAIDIALTVAENDTRAA